jgi:hypothetical protein
VNYGLGERIQLKYELPWSLAETRGEAARVVGGLGNSLFGVKWRFYERALHHVSTKTGDDAPRFAVSIYPQAAVNNPTASRERGIVEPGPQVLLPVEGEAKIGPVRVVLETGRWFRHESPDLWVHGLMLGRQFSRKTELYAELYSQHTAHKSAEGDIENELTLGIGTRRPITRSGGLRLLAMAGRSAHRATPANGEPSWIAYIGLQVLVVKTENEGGDFRR